MSRSSRPANPSRVPSVIVIQSKIVFADFPPYRDQFMILDAVLAKIFGTKNEREIKEMLPLVAAIGDLEPEMEALSDIDLAAKTITFKEQILQGASLDDLLIPAFAVVR